MQITPRTSLETLKQYEALERASGQATGTAEQIHLAQRFVREEVGELPTGTSIADVEAVARAELVKVDILLKYRGVDLGSFKGASHEVRLGMLQTALGEDRFKEFVDSTSDGSGGLRSKLGYEASEPSTNGPQKR